MKTIEDQVREIAKEFGYDSYFGHGEHLSEAVKKGVKIAQRWIPVEEELPKVYENCGWDRTDEVLAKLGNGEYVVLRYYAEIIEDDKPAAWVDRRNFEYFTVTHWRPIEYK